MVKSCSIVFDTRLNSNDCKIKGITRSSGEITEREG